MSDLVLVGQGEHVERDGVARLQTQLLGQSDAHFSAQARRLPGDLLVLHQQGVKNRKRKTMREDLKCRYSIKRPQSAAHHYLCSHQPKNCAKPSYCNRNLLVATTQLQKPSDMAAGFLLSSGGKITLGLCPNFRNVALILRREKKGHGDAGAVTEALQRSSTGLSCGFSCDSPIHRHSRESTTVTLMKLFADDEMLFSCFCFCFYREM